jgi:hypothetical protein
VDDLFLTSAKELIAGCKAGLATEFKMKDICYRVQDEGHLLDALFLGVRGIADIGRDLPWSREVHSRDLEEIQDGEL